MPPVVWEFEAREREGQSEVSEFEEREREGRREERTGEAPWLCKIEDDEDADDGGGGGGVGVVCV